MKAGRVVLLLLLVALVVVGLTRVRIDTDVFSLLPDDSPMVEGLRLFQKSFGSSQSIIISVKTADADSTTQVTETLAHKLQDAGLARQVIWRSPFQNDTEALAEFIAYLWFNQTPARFQAMAKRFDDAQLQKTLQHSIERMSTSFNTQEVARLAHDPFSLTGISDAISGSLVDMSRNPFASSDGRMRIVYVPFPGAQPNFWEYREWLRNVDQLIARWQASDEVASQSTIQVTGNPVFVTEFGSRLLRDVLMAAVSTLIIIALLFAWAHRRLAPLMWLMLILVITVTATIALSGFLFSSLNAISLGFAAILIGLAVDYALILYQEWRTHEVADPRALRRLMAPSILWAAITTASAFVMVSRSSLPGLAQLGLLVAAGIVIAAVLMLTVYVSLISRSRQSATNLVAVQDNKPGVFIGNRKWVWSITLVLFIVSIIVLLVRAPSIQYGVAALKFENNQARVTLEEIQEEITGMGSELWLLVTGANDSEVADHLSNANNVLSHAIQQGVLSRAVMPTQLWPQPEYQKQNRDVARALVQRLPAVEAAAVAAGFTADSMQLTAAIFKVWQQFAELNTVAWPQQPASQWLFRQFAANDGGQMVALGQLQAAQGVSKEQLQALAVELAAAQGGQLVSWSLMADSLVDTMRHDFTNVVLPMVVVLVVMLGLAYRSVREIALSFALLFFSLICLSAAMGAFGWSWNLMNMTAIPLLLGAGVDYSIHIQLALKRYSGDQAQVRRSVGNAILLCGASTAAAFASLGFASNPGLASLGRVVALGIVIAVLAAVFLLPVWWATVHGQDTKTAR